MEPKTKKDQNMLALHTSQYLHIKKAINNAIQKQMEHRNKTNSNTQTINQKKTIKEAGLIYLAYPN